MSTQLLYRPLNPFFGMLPVLLSLVTTWAVVQGHRRAWPMWVAATSVAAQANLAFVPLVASMVVFILITWLVGLLRATSKRTHLRDALRARSIWIAAGLGCLLWLPVIVELIRNNPNNVQQLVAWVQSGAGTNTRTGLREAIRHVAILAPAPGGFRGYSFDFLTAGSPLARAIGGLVLLALTFVAFAPGKFPGRHAARIPAQIAVVANIALVATAALMPRYPNAPYWLAHWIPVATFTWSAVAMGGAARWERISPALPSWPVARIGLGVAAVSVVLQTAGARPALENGSSNTTAAAIAVDNLGDGRGRSVRIHGLGFVPLLGTAPAVAFELQRNGWEPHYLLPWPFPEDAEHLWLDSDPAPTEKIIIVDSSEPDFNDGIPTNAQMMGRVEIGEKGRMLTLYRVPGSSPEAKEGS
ncbi:hypothetical protein [Janibacter sp. UYMM211]|uniref:hypothetical protein n=1 Tax=Janibacter sp. UYMM211 TaxID=3156342 RepID=UPI00339A3B5E